MRASRTDRRDRGQSLVEFALILPLLLVLVLGALDFGRLFYAWVTLNNSARVAANFAGIDPNASFAAGSEYDTTVKGEGLGGLMATCPLPGGATSTPTPTFTDGAADTNTTTKDIGDEASVSISCRFHVITPVISTLVGSDVTLSATAVFQIRTGPYRP